MIIILFISLCIIKLYYFCFFFFFNDTATTEIYTLSLHDALPIYFPVRVHGPRWPGSCQGNRSEEHTSELQSRENHVCRLLLEKKKKNKRPQSFKKKKKKKGTTKIKTINK